jgi:hypothetical protein
MGIAVGDADGDRRLDLFVTNLDHEANALYQNAGAYFDYASRSAGVYEPSYPWVGFGTAFADLDSDADLDLVVANGHVIDNIELTSDAQTWRQPGSVLWNDGRGRFRAAAPEELGDFGVPRAGRGLLLLDLDDDGRLELLVTHSADRARLYRNAWPEQGAWIGFVLEGSGANTAAIGARVTVEVDGRTLVRESAAGGSYAGSHDPRLVFGLGDAQRPERVTVRWPGGATGEHAHLEAGRYWRLAPDAEPVALGAE